MIDITNIKKYANKEFKTKRLRKKQISVLRRYLNRMNIKYHIIGQHITLNGPIGKKEELICRISMVAHAVDLINRRDEIPVYKPLPAKEVLVPTFEIEGKPTVHTRDYLGEYKKMKVEERGITLEEAEKEIEKEKEEFKKMFEKSLSELERGGEETIKPLEEE